MTKRPFLYPEQYLILLVMAVLLCWGAGWGLVSRQRVELLTHGLELSAQQKQALTQGREKFYERLDSIRRRQAEGITRRLVEGGRIELGEWGELPGRELDPALKITALRAYLLGSEAMDERYTYRALANINPAALDLDPKSYIYGGAYLYPVGALIYLGKLTGLIQVSRDLAWYLDHPGQMARLYLVGRGVNLAAFLGVLLVLALWGRRLGSRAAGSLAMLAWALSWLPWWETLVSKPHTYAAFWSLLGLYLLDGYARQPRARRLWLGAAALGMAMGSSLPAAILALALPVFLYEPGRGWGWLGRCLGGWLVMAAVFAVTNPYAFLSYQVYLLTMAEHLLGGGWDYGTVAWGKPLAYLRDMGLRFFAFPLGLAGLVGVVVEALRRQSPLKRLARLLLVLLALWSFTVAAGRISLFLAGPLCLLAGWLLSRLVVAGSWAPAGVRAVVLGLVLVPGLVGLAVQAKAALAGETWYGPTKAWLESGGLAPGVSVGVYEQPDPTRLPPFPFLNRRVVILKQWQPGQEPPEVVIVNQGELSRLWPYHPLSPRYEPVAELGRPPFCPPWLGYFLVACPERASSYARAFRLKR